MGLLSKLGFGSKANWTPDQFWAWIQSDEAQRQIQQINSSDERKAAAAQREFGQSIKRVNPDLVWGILYSKKGDWPSQLEVSAGGIKSVVPAVQALVAAAPAIPGWKIVAFKQPTADFSIKVGDQEVDRQNVLVSYEPVSDGRYNLNIFVPVPAGVPKQAIAEVGFIMLDHTLGEYAVMTRIAGLEFESTLVAPPTAIPVAEFSKMLDES